MSREIRLETHCLYQEGQFVGYLGSVSVDGHTLLRLAGLNEARRLIKAIHDAGYGQVHVITSAGPSYDLTIKPPIQSPNPNPEEPWS